MATRLEDEFDPTRINAPDAAYPAGSLKDETTPGVSDDGTPLASRVGNDWQGFSQSALDKAGIAANGQPDSVSNPQILQAIEQMYNDGDSQLAGGNIWPLSSQNGAQVGDTGLSNVSILIDSSTSPSTHYRTSEKVSGDITALDFPAGTATVGGVSVTLSEDLTDLKIDNIELMQAIESVRDGAKAVVTSYIAGWAATTLGPKGGGEFVFILGGTDNDEVVNFSNSSGSWKRVNFQELDITMSGARTDNVVADNDAAILNLTTYCNNNNRGFSMTGIYEIDTTIDTTGVVHIFGENRDFDGFSMPDSAGKIIIDWQRPTILKRIRVIGGLADQSIDDGSIALDGAPFLNRAESIALFNCGTGQRVHDAVSCHHSHVTISNCNRGLLLDGFDSNAEFSTTLSYSDCTFQGNYDGVVGGNVGAFNTNVIGINFHNCVWESNTHAGIVISDQLLNGTQYDSLDLRNLTFSGFAWFEGNTSFAFVLDKCLDVMFHCQLRNENSQPTIYPDSSRIASYEAQQARFGNNSDRYTDYSRDGQVATYSGFAQPDFPLFTHNTFGDGGDESIRTSYFEVQQSLDYNVVGRLTKYVWGLKEEADLEAVTKMTLSRAGNLTITGTYSPFTGVHLFWSPDFIGTGVAVRGVNFNRRDVYQNDTSIEVEGDVEITTIENDKTCLGVVDFAEKIDNGWMVSVAAVGDNSTKNMAGAQVVGEWTPGDFLSTSSQPGKLKAYHDNDMRCVVMQTKGERDGLAYGYFK